MINRKPIWLTKREQTNKQDNNKLIVQLNHFNFVTLYEIGKHEDYRKGN